MAFTLTLLQLAADIGTANLVAMFSVIRMKLRR